MRIHSPAPGRRRHAAVAALFLCLAAGPALAGPDTADAADPVLKLLADKGLLAT
jgi:hypothetical protein